ncbi:TPA: hypothetical protein N0F65_004707 [Lagenidium giganteum]|uniref:Palmitoyltransferase n=1 Tax=Lagenidium giganteum TaxID=4803 RepID=A0AAV2Z298_9STRA|nr:TPA: hypothetical protein N0F65_004707 [Lagenidium giganteum]
MAETKPEPKLRTMPRHVCAACGPPDATAESTDTCAKCSAPLKPPTVFDCARWGLAAEFEDLVESDENFDINALEESSNATVLHHAAINNKMRILEYIMKHPKLSQEIQIDKLGGALQTTPLFWAAYHNHVYAVELLLRHGANANFRDEAGFNPFLLAIQRCFPILAAYLIAKGSDVDARVNDDIKKTALMILCHRQQFHLDSMRMLLALRPSIDAQDEQGNTALHYAVKNDVSPAVRMLLDNGANTKLANAEGMTALDMAKKHLPKRSISRHLIEEDDHLERLAKRTRFSQKKFLQDHLFKGSFIVPWFALPGIAWIFANANGIMLTIALEATLLGVAFMALKFFQRGTYGDKRKAAALLFGVNVASITYLCGAIPYYSIQYASWPFRVVLLVSVYLMVYNLYKTAVTDAGVFGTSYREKIYVSACNIQALVEVKSPIATKLCLTCLHRRPLRSKHCAEMNVCVARFDHYCPFVVNAVGAENHHYFYGFLFFAVSSIGLGLVCICRYVFDQSNVVWDKSIIMCVLSVVHRHPVVVCAITLSVVHIAWIGYLLAMHTYLVLDALTTNELMKNENQSRAYSRGVVRNIIDFFRLPGHLRVDWTQINRIEDFTAEQKKHK